MDAIRSRTCETRPALAEATAVILAGGLGTRLRPVIADRPKVLAPVRGRPFLHCLLDQVADAGIRCAVLCTGYLGEQVRAVCGESFRGMRLAYSQEPEPLGTAGALRLAHPLIASHTALVMNGDSYCDVDLPAFWAWHTAREADATVLLRRMPDTARYGRVCVDASGLILAFEEKGEAAGPGWVNGGIYLLKRHMLSEIPGRGPVSLEREVFPAWIGRRLYGYRSGGPVLDIGTPEAYVAAHRSFPGPRDPGGRAADDHTRDGGQKRAFGRRVAATPALRYPGDGEGR